MAARKITTLLHAKRVITALSKQLTAVQEALARAHETIDSLKK